MGREDLNYRRGRSGRPLERLKRQIYATETHCRRCGKEVDLTLPYTDPVTGKVNKWSKTVGHRTELDAGGEPYDAGLEHLHCNTQAGQQYGQAKRTRTRPQDLGLRTSPHLE
jgi:hypothetical protein